MKSIIAVSLLLMSVLFSLAGDNKGANAQKKSARTTPATSNGDREGQERFETHCGRCHNPPEQLSPRVAAAVIKHMRTRAMLSAEDEKLIIQFIAPK